MKLKDYLDKYGMRYRDFAQRLGISYSALYLLFKGIDCKLSLALKIEEETNREVRCKDLLMTKEKSKDKPKKKGDRSHETCNELKNCPQNSTTTDGYD